MLNKRIKYLLVFMCLVLFTSCTKQDTHKHVNTRFSGDHTTAQIRGMFSICFDTRVKAVPYLPAPFHFEHCDCLIDKSRENFSSKQYDSMGKDNLTEFFTQASIACDQSAKVAKDPIEL